VLASVVASEVMLDGPHVFPLAEEADQMIQDYHPTVVHIGRRLAGHNKKKAAETTAQKAADSYHAALHKYKLQKAAIKKEAKKPPHKKVKKKKTKKKKKKKNVKVVAAMKIIMKKKVPKKVKKKKVKKKVKNAPNWILKKSSHHKKHKGIPASITNRDSANWIVNSHKVLKGPAIDDGESFSNHAKAPPAAAPTTAADLPVPSASWKNALLEEEEARKRFKKTETPQEKAAKPPPRGGTAVVIQSNEIRDGRFREAGNWEDTVLTVVEEQPGIPGLW